MIPPSRMPQTGFMTAPAGISPWVTYLQRAMSSLRASATIEMRRVRPRSEPTLYMSGYRSPCLRRSAPPGPTWMFRPRGARDNDSAFPDASDWLHDSTRRDLAMGDISPEGDEQFAGERYDRDAAGPAAL